MYEQKPSMSLHRENKFATDLPPPPQKMKLCVIPEKAVNVKITKGIYFGEYKLYQNGWYWDMTDFSDLFQYVINQFRS